jgi:EF-P beta-lysylation protein EpmB
MQVALGKKAMITRREIHSQPAWRRELARAITDPEILLDTLGLDCSLVPGARRAARLFGLRVPRGFVARMTPGDPRDPLLRQVLPLDEELTPSPGFTSDPVGDGCAETAPGLLQKYAGRALLVASGTCAVNCRYCFRREFPYAGHTTTGARRAAAIRAIADDPSVREVILSGGDPLVLSDERLRELTDSLASIPHVARLRVHTRLPVVLPERVDDGLLDWLSAQPWPTVIVVHANHPREIDNSVAAAFRRLRDAGATLLNQSVLLKGVNDRPGSLAELSEALFAAGVLPYYLHMLDKVTGTAHFEVSDDRARRIMSALADHLPGYLVPRLVREIPGARAKRPVSVWPEHVHLEAASPRHPL